MEELKKLNEIDMNAYIPQAREEVPEEEKKVEVNGEQEENGESAIESSTTSAKVDYMEQIKKAREQAAIVEFKFAEEEILQKMEEEKKVKVEQERKAAAQKPVVIKPPRPNSAQKNLKIKQKQPNKQRNEFEKMQQEAQLEIDRLMMENEDKLSMQAEVYFHQ